MKSTAPALALLLAVLSAPGPAAALQRGDNAAVLALLDAAEQELNAGRPDQASVVLERALRIEPRNPAIWHYLGLARLAQGNPAQAEAMAAKSRSLAPPDDEPTVVASLNPFDTVLERASTYIDTWQQRKQPVVRSPDRKQADDRYAEQVRRQRAARQGRSESQSEVDVRRDRGSRTNARVRLQI